jgi:hypothetical protein
VGIIDTLSAGFEVVRRKPWLVLAPVALDIGLWIAPKLSITRLFRQAMALLISYPGAGSNMREMAQALEQATESINLASLLAPGYLGVPNLLVSGPSFFGMSRQVIEVTGALALMALVTALSLGGLLIGALYLGPIAQEVRDGEIDWPALFRRLPRYWLRLTGASLLVVFVMLFFVSPLGLMFGLFGLFSQGLASIMLGMVWFSVLWVALYLAFVPQAILVGDDGVLQAIGHSISIVRMSFWSTLGLLVLVNVIMAGLMLVWDLLTVSAPGALLAIAANAYVGTGLAAAVLIFYRERLQAWQQAVDELRSQMA